jgi:Spy/CpxP family protein refolding chaperone
MTSTSPRFVALVALLSIAACKSQESQGTPPAPSAASTASAAPSAPTNDDASAAAPADGGGAEAQAPKRAIPRNAGHVTMILSAINSLDLRDPEKNQKLDAIAKSFTETDGTRDEGRKIHDELSAQVKAGKIETAKLEPLYAELEKAAKEAHDKEVVALDGIYAALGPIERTTIANQLQQKLTNRDAHLAKARPDAGSPADERKQVAERMAKNLGLDEAQQKKVEAVLPTNERQRVDADREEDKKNTTALLAAFAKDGFSAKTLPYRDPKKLRVPFQEQAKVFAQLLPILKPEQREKLAASMTHARGPHFGGPRGPMGKPGPHGPHGWGDHEP